MAVPHRRRRARPAGVPRRANLTPRSGCTGGGPTQPRPWGTELGRTGPMAACLPGARQAGRAAGLAAQRSGVSGPHARVASPLAMGLTPEGAEGEVPKLALRPDWANRLNAGQVRAVHEEAATRLRQAGWESVPPPPGTARDIHGVRLAAALVAPAKSCICSRPRPPGSRPPSRPAHPERAPLRLLGPGARGRDRAACLTYAVAGQQSGYVMRGYKAQTPVDEHRLIVALLVVLGLSIHAACAGYR